MYEYDYNAALKAARSALADQGLLSSSAAAGVMGNLAQQQNERNAAWNLQQRQQAWAENAQQQELARNAWQAQANYALAKAGITGNMGFANIKKNWWPNTAMNTYAAYKPLAPIPYKAGPTGDPTGGVKGTRAKGINAIPNAALAKSLLGAEGVATKGSKALLQRLVMEALANEPSAVSTKSAASSGKSTGSAGPSQGYRSVESGWVEPQYQKGVVDSTTPITDSRGAAYWAMRNQAAANSAAQDEAWNRMVFGAEQARSMNEMNKEYTNKQWLANLALNMMKMEDTEAQTETGNIEKALSLWREWITQEDKPYSFDVLNSMTMRAWGVDLEELLQGDPEAMGVKSATPSGLNWWWYVSNPHNIGKGYNPSKKYPWFTPMQFGDWVGAASKDVRAAATDVGNWLK